MYNFQKSLHVNDKGNNKNIKKKTNNGNDDTEDGEIDE